jgi:hypothetical protein
LKLQKLKPSVGLMRLWIVSIIIFFVITFSDDFSGSVFFKSSIILNLYSFIINFFWSLVDLTNIFPENEWKTRGEGYKLVINFTVALSSTIVYIITSALAYLMAMWVKEGFSKS